MATFTTTSAPELLRIPGLYRRFELIYLLEPGEIYRIEDAGTTSDGTDLFAIYRRKSFDISVPAQASN